MNFVPKGSFLGIVLATTLFAGCGSDKKSVSDPALCSKFEVENLSNYALSLTFKPEYPTKQPVSLGSGETKEIYELCTIGDNPNFALKPSEVLNSFSVKLASKIVYEGIVDSAWQKTVIENRHARFRLVLKDEQLQL